jgi:pyridoxal phosphate-dependent aminotransferase EpsN
VQRLPSNGYFGKGGIYLAKQRIYLSPPHMNGLELEYIKEAFDTNWIAPVGPHEIVLKEKSLIMLG